MTTTGQPLRSRQPKGSPIGGEYAPEKHARGGDLEPFVCNPIVEMTLHTPLGQEFYKGTPAEIVDELHRDYIDGPSANHPPVVSDDETLGGFLESTGRDLSEFNLPADTPMDSPIWVASGYYGEEIVSLTPIEIDEKRLHAYAQTVTQATSIEIEGEKDPRIPGRRADKAEVIRQYSANRRLVDKRTWAGERDDGANFIALYDDQGHLAVTTWEGGQQNLDDPTETRHPEPGSDKTIEREYLLDDGRSYLVSDFKDGTQEWSYPQASILLPADRVEGEQCVAQVVTEEGQRFEALARFDKDHALNWVTTGHVRLPWEKDFSPVWNPKAKDPWKRVKAVYPYVTEHEVYAWAQETVDPTNIDMSAWRPRDPYPHMSVKNVVAWDLVTQEELDAEPQWNENTVNNLDTINALNAWRDDTSEKIRARLEEREGVTMPSLDFYHHTKLGHSSVDLEFFPTAY